MVHAVEQLKGFSRTLLTDGYTAYTERCRSSMRKSCSLNMRIVGLTADEPLKGIAVRAGWRTTGARSNSQTVWN